MTAAHIPKHHIHEKFEGQLAALWQINNDHEQYIHYAHRDDYYMFLYLEQGDVTIAVDFEEHNIHAPAILVITPGQVHQFLTCDNINGCVLIVDKMITSPPCKETFQCTTPSGVINLNCEQTTDLKYCLSILDRRINHQSHIQRQEVTHDLLNTYIGMVAEIYQTSNNRCSSKRSAEITTQFKTLLAANYKSLKKPSQYAAALNISPIYLNEVIKKRLGMTVTATIHNEVTIQAKRLLFYTALPIKEIAFDLGYDDHAYFTRLFTQTTSLTPTQFRAKYLK